MAESRLIRNCIIVKATPDWRERYKMRAAVSAHLGEAFKKFYANVSSLVRLIEVIDLPSQWQLAKDDSLPYREGSEIFDKLVVTVTLAVDDASDPDGVIKILTEDLPNFLRREVEGFEEIGIDLPILSAGHWCPGDSGQFLFGTRMEASALIGKPYLHRNGVDLKGRNVNVVVIDQGVHAASIPGNYVTGWTRDGQAPGTGDVRGHGMMIVRSILDVAPHARIFDCPLIPRAPRGVPPKIEDLPIFLGHAKAAWLIVLWSIFLWKIFKTHPGPWVIVNAWAAYDRKTEFPKGAYTNNPLHFFNRAMDLAHLFGHDVIFCAGNCGTFCPDFRCGIGDRGPCESILGANSHPKVITMSAVRSDATWLGFSSEGPGQPALDMCKPDLCAPSQFCEVDDAFLGNIGTSAATAVAAGVVAALREKWDSSAVDPGAMKQVLIDTARKIEGPAWNGRVGHGVIDAENAHKRLLSLVTA